MIESDDDMCVATQEIDAPPAAAAAAADPDDKPGMVPVRVANIPNIQGKRFMVTLWDEKMPGEWHIIQMTETLIANRKATYICWGHERGTTTGRIHWHVYIRFETKRGAKTVAGYFAPYCGKNLWVEKARGNEKECRDYCWKEGKHVAKAGASIEHGQEGAYDPNQCEQQGRRTDIEVMVARMKEGAGPAQLAEEFPGDYMRMHTGIDKMCAHFNPQPPVEREIEIILLHGGSGLGKTHRVMHAFPDCYPVKPGRSPFDGYKGQETIFFDEFDCTKWDVQDMNRYLDKWRCPLDCRYNNKYAAWTRVVICINDMPHALYPNISEPLLKAFRRRLHGRCWAVNSRGPTIQETMAQDPTPL